MGREEEGRRKKKEELQSPFLPSDIFLTSATLGIAWIIVSVFQLPVSPQYDPSFFHHEIEERRNEIERDGKT